MTNAEHLIDNAINCLEDKSGYEGFIESPCNKAMAESININLQHVWKMAQHIYCCIKPLWEMNIRGDYMTNGDRIRQMSNEELAELGIDFPCEICIKGECCCDYKCVEGIKAYLDMEMGD